MKKTKIKNFIFSNSANKKDVIQNGVAGKAVEIPHTWNVENGTEEYIGTTWYSTKFVISKPSFKTVFFPCSIP